MLDEYVRRWQLEVDGEPIVTPRARLVPVRHDGRPAMLKVATYPAEVIGNAVLQWWNSGVDDAGSGAARVFLADGPAVVMERAVAPRSLLRLYDEGRFDEAIAVIVGTAQALHAPRTEARPQGLVPLERWFADLATAAERDGGMLRSCAEAAARVLAEPGERVVLHGDLHHENILDFGPRGWRAIDPKAVEGDRCFDYVHLFFDPDDAQVPDLDAILHQLALTARLAGIDPDRLRTWLLAWAGLSAVWWLEHGASAEPALKVASMLAPTVSEDSRA